MTSGMKKFFSSLFPGLKSSSARRTPDDPKRYSLQKRIGQGSFGSVWEAKDRVSGKLVAIKKVRIGSDGNAEHELSMNVPISHKNVIRMIGHFREVSKEKELDENGKSKIDPDNPPIDMCIVLEYSRTSLKDCIDEFRKKGKVLPNQVITLLTFQLFRGLHYLHSLGIIHRDVKPSNLLINKKTFLLQISDLGHAIKMVDGEPRDTRACSAPYRAPEMELGNEDYHERVDIWASGCLIAECYTGEILFREVKNVSQYDRIRQLLGDPTPEDLAEMQPLLPKPPAARFPSMFDQRFARIRPPVPDIAIALIKKCLTYKPSGRPSAIQACADAYYEPLRQTANYDRLLYDFAEEELANVAPDLVQRIIPARCLSQLKRIWEDSVRMAKTAKPAEPSVKSLEKPDGKKSK